MSSGEPARIEPSSSSIVVNSPPSGLSQNFWALAFLISPGTFIRPVAASNEVSMLVTGTAPVMIIGLPCSAVISRILATRAS